MQTTFQIANPEVLDRLKNAGQYFDRAAQAFLTKAGLIAVSVAKQKVPRDKATLGQSIVADPPKKSGTMWSAAIGTNVGYARYQEEGTGLFGPRKRMITPTRARALRFRTKDGKVVFARAVKGTRAKWYLKQGVEAIADNEAIAMAEADKIILGEL